jgi:hypothetical protein
MSGLIGKVAAPATAPPGCLDAAYWTLSEQSWGYVLQEAFVEGLSCGGSVREVARVADVDAQVDLASGADTALFGYRLTVDDDGTVFHACAAEAVVTDQLLESKCNFALSVQQARADDGAPCNVCPPTFIVPADLNPTLLLRDDYNDADDVNGVITHLRQISTTNPWVLKLDGSSCGLAVNIVTSPEQVATLLQREQDSNTVSAAPLNWVCQRHIARPLLVRGNRKFHLRAFTLTMNGKTFLFEGALFARLCAEPWSDKDLQDPLKNLSNHTQAQKNLPGGAAAEVHVGLLATSDELPLLQSACPLLLERTRTLLRRTIRIGQVNDTTVGGSQGKPCTGNDSWTRFCLLAFDIMVNEDGRLFILEVNRGPGGIERDTAGLSVKFRAGMRQMIRETIVLTAAENMRESNKSDLAERFLSNKKIGGFVPLLVPGINDGPTEDDGTGINDATVLAIRRRNTRNGVAVRAEKMLFEHSGGLSGIVQQSFVDSGEEDEEKGEEKGEQDREEGKSHEEGGEGENDEAAAVAEAQEIKKEWRARKQARGWRNHLLGFEDQQGRSALHLAVITGAGADVCQLLIDVGADATKTMGVGGAPVLHYSVTTGNADSCAVVQTLLKGGASALTTYEGISALEMAAGAAAAMVDANDSGDGTKHTQTTMETTLDIVKALLRAAREEAATVANVTMADNKGTFSTLTENQAVANLLSGVPSRSDYNAIMDIGKNLNLKLEERINGTVTDGSGEHVSYRDTTAAEDAAAIAKGLANSTKEATFAFDDSRTCAAWLKKGKEDMETEHFEEAASSFYQAMVGAEDEDMVEAQNLLKIAVQAARAAKGLPFLQEYSSSEGEGDY